MGGDVMMPANRKSTSAASDITTDDSLLSRLGADFLRRLRMTMRHVGESLPVPARRWNQGAASVLIPVRATQLESPANRSRAARRAARY